MLQSNRCHLAQSEQIEGNANILIETTKMSNYCPFQPLNLWKFSEIWSNTAWMQYDDRDGHVSFFKIIFSTMFEGVRDSHSGVFPNQVFFKARDHQPLIASIFLVKIFDTAIRSWKIVRGSGKCSIFPFMRHLALEFFSVSLDRLRWCSICEFVNWSCQPSSSTNSCIRSGSKVCLQLNRDFGYWSMHGDKIWQIIGIA